ncbi:rhodanese-like domain protein [Haloferula helveola]|uniref:Rhodanese-like domain protein n=1 Tax=Haloferula helveola TaxID=490095 RepID=A0ABN6H708_9BACT|nr:rhodanese-like domain protein [Haloferula helveola]
MRTTVFSLLMVTAFGIQAQEPEPKVADANPKIDYPAFIALSSEVAKIREKRRISEDEFLRMAAEEGTVILDTRSRANFEKLHVKGAIHLNFSDFTKETLAAAIPDKTTRILIYCNNNFEDAGEAMLLKSKPLALNIPTFINLYGYGYENLYELAPYLKMGETKIPFEGTDVLKPDEK